MNSLLLVPLYFFASTTSLIQATPPVAVFNQQAVEMAQEVFKGTPLMSIAYCESGLRQYESENVVLHGRIDHDDIGFMQINARYHDATAKKLGFDIYTIQGNIMYARWLYDHQGLAPWKASKDCWKDRPDYWRASVDDAHYRPSNYDAVPRSGDFA